MVTTIEHTTYKWENQHVVGDTNAGDLVITCDEGYVFDGNVRLFSQSSGTYYNPDTKTDTEARFNLKNVDATWIVYGDTAAIPDEGTVYNIAHTSSQWENKELIDGTWAGKLVIECDAGYEFEGDVTIKSRSSGSSYVATSQTATRATFEQKRFDVDWDVIGFTKAVQGITDNQIPNTVDQSTRDLLGTHVKIVCADGYKFAAAPQMSYTDDYGTPQTATLTLSENDTVATGDADTTKNTVTVTGQTVADTPQPTGGVTVNVEHATGGGTFNGTQWNITVTAESGYHFETAPTAQYNDVLGEPHTVALTLGGDNKTATAAIAGDEDTEITVTGAAVADTPQPVEPTVTNNIEGVTENHTYTDGTMQITLTGTDTSKRIIEATVTYYEGDFLQSEPFTVAADGKTATATITGVNAAQPVVISGRYENVCLVENNLTNCTASGLKEYYAQDDTVNVTLTANTGDIFRADDDVPTLWYWRSLNGNADQTSKAFTISQDGKTASVTLDMSGVLISYPLTFEGGAVPQTVIGENYGAINVYVVTLDQLAAFAKVRFIAGTAGNIDYIDLGKYVNRIKRIYAEIDTAADDVIRCGNYNTGVAVRTPATDLLTLDFGNVAIPAHNDDNTDYQGETQVFLPFVGFVSVPQDYVGRSVNLTYKVNVVTGGGVALLSCDGIVFITREIQPSDNIIYRTADNELTLIGGDDWQDHLLLGLTPYIYNKWYTSKSSDTNNDNTRGVISSFSGFNVFSDITPIHTPEMLTEEQEIIYTALMQGVYVE